MAATSSDENGRENFSWLFRSFLVFCFLCSLVILAINCSVSDCFFNLALGEFSLLSILRGGQTLMDEMIELLSFSQKKREISRYVCQVCKRSLAPVM